MWDLVHFCQWMMSYNRTVLRRARLKMSSFCDGHFVESTAVTDAMCDLPRATNAQYLLTCFKRGYRFQQIAFSHFLTAGNLCSALLLKFACHSTRWPKTVPVLFDRIHVPDCMAVIRLCGQILTIFLVASNRLHEIFIRQHNFGPWRYLPRSLVVYWTLNSINRVQCYWTSVSMFRESGMHSFIAVLG